MTRYALAAALMAVALPLAAGSANAADLPRAVYKAPAYAPIPAYFSWTGFMPA